MFKLIVLPFLLCFIFVNSISAYSFYKKGNCSSKDSPCIAAYYHSVIQKAAESGIPEIGVPVLDPYVFQNLKITFLGLVKVNFEEGTVKGLKTCKSNRFDVDLENKMAFVEYVCESIHVQGKHNLEATDALKVFLGGIDVHGKGTSSLHIENIHINAHIPLEIKELEDHELHGIPDYKGITYSYEVLGKAAVTADNLFVGDQDISSVAVNIFNGNWKYLIKILGKNVIDVGMEVFAENSNKFAKAVPLKEILSDDLSAYVTP